MKTEITFLFPPFVNEYLGNETSILLSMGYDIKPLLQQASDYLNIRLTDFHETDNSFLENELYSQYIAYIYSCGISEVLSQKEIFPSLSSGYSMGIYAALFQAKSIDFRSGLSLISHAYECIKAQARGKEYCMATIVGLSFQEISELISSVSPDLEIINRNNQHTYMISGIKLSVQRVVDLATAEGALYTRILRVSSPYHSHYMDQAAVSFAKYLEKIPIQDAQTPLISLLSQNIFQSSHEIKQELADNIHHHMNWEATMNTMVQMGRRLFIECGAGESLSKINKFIDGDIKTLQLSRLQKYLKHHSIQ